jgi:ribulose-phosphate 3-epimerase
MDGHFVDNISFGIPVVQSIRKITDMFLDVHLMISNPLKYIDAFSDAGADLITFHYETQYHPVTSEIIRKIHSCGKKAGIAIKPATPVENLYYFIGQADLMLIMTVEPGFGGQEFMPSCVGKISTLTNHLKTLTGESDVRFSECVSAGNSVEFCQSGISFPIIQVDGGISDKTAKSVKDAGATSLVSGSYLLNKLIRGEKVEL